MGRVEEFIRILNTSFDAGFLVTDRGEILHGNDASQKMFTHMSHSRLGNIHTHLTFLAPQNIDLNLSTITIKDNTKNGDTDGSGSVEAISWEEVVNLLLVQQMGMPELAQIDHWKVIGTNKESHEFTAKVKLTLLPGATKEEPYVMIFIRNVDVNHGIHAKQQQKQASAVLTEQKHQVPIAATAIHHHHHHHPSEAQDPSFTLNPNGIIIEFNQTALEKVPWCKQELVGRHISMIDVGLPEASKPAQHECHTYLDKEQSSIVHCKGIISFSELTTATAASTEKGVNKKDSHNYTDNMTMQSSSFTSYPQQIDNIMTSIVEASVDPLFLISERGIIQMVNGAAVEEFGWTRSEMMGMNISLIVGGGHGQNHDEYIKRYLKTGVAKVLGKRRELQAKRKNGSEFPVELVAAEVPVFYPEQGEKGEGENDSKAPDDERLFVGFVRNLTDIQQKQRMSTGIIDSSQDPILVINEEGTIRMANGAAACQFGWTREELVGSNIHSIIAPEYVHYLFGKHQRRKIDMPARRKNGSFFPIQLGMSELPELNGERLFCETIYDMTQINKDASLRVGVIEASMSPMFLIDEKGIIQMVNQAAVDLFGWDRQEFMGSNIKMIAGGAHRKYHDDYIQHYIETGETKIIGNNRELPARRKDGEEFRIELRVTEVELEYGESRIFCGYVHDLSSIKMKDRLINGILEASKESMFVINKKGTIKMINELAANDFSWPRGDLIDKSIGTIAGGEFIDNNETFVTKLIQQTADNSVGKKNNYPGRGKDGVEFPLEIGLTEIPGEDQMFCGHVQKLSSIVGT